MFLFCVYRRERNRMHAKLTRDRKKLFTSRMQQTIQTLERHNQLLRNRLNNMIFTGIGRSTSGNHLVAIKEEATHLPPPLTSLPIPGFPPAHPVGLGHPALPNAYARASAVTNLANMNAYTKFGLMTANGWMGPMFPRSWPASYEYNTSIQPMPGAASAFPLPIPNTSNSNPHANHGNNPSNANV